MGALLSHGYLSNGFLQCRIAFPTLAAILLPSGEVSDAVLIDTFLSMVSPVEANLCRNSLTMTCPSFRSQLQSRLTSILSRFGSRLLPIPANLKIQLIQSSRYECLVKPAAAIQAIRLGIPPSHVPFWQQLSVDQLYDIYLALTASPEKIIEMIAEPVGLDRDQERILAYLYRFIGTMKPQEAKAFLRFVTGTCVCTSQSITITFNQASGFTRCPVEHTYASTLELPSTYET